MSPTQYENLLQKYMSTTKALLKKGNSKDNSKAKNSAAMSINNSKVVNTQKMTRNSFFNGVNNTNITATTKTDSNAVSNGKSPYSINRNSFSKDQHKPSKSPRQMPTDTMHHIYNLAKNAPKLTVRDSTSNSMKIMNLQSIYSTKNSEGIKKINHKLNATLSRDISTGREGHLMGTIKIPIKTNQNITLNINGDVSTINISNKQQSKVHTKDHSLEPFAYTARGKSKEYSFLKPGLIKQCPKEGCIVKNDKRTNISFIAKDTIKIVPKKGLSIKKDSVTILGEMGSPPTARYERPALIDSISTAPSTSRNISLSTSKTSTGPTIDLVKSIQSFKEQLLDHELTEIKQFVNLYYVGIKKVKIIPNNKQPNNGWDDDKEFYIVNPKDHLNYRYEIIKLIGKGSFGCVYKCIDHKTHSSCAIKILRNKEKFHKQGDVEITLLEMLNSNGHFVKIIDSFKFRNHIVNHLSVHRN